MGGSAESRGQAGPLALGQEGPPARRVPVGTEAAGEAPCTAPSVGLSGSLGPARSIGSRLQLHLEPLLLRRDAKNFLGTGVLSKVTRGEEEPRRSYLLGWSCPSRTAGQESPPPKGPRSQTQSASVTAAPSQARRPPPRARRTVTGAEEAAEGRSPGKEVTSAISETAASPISARDQLCHCHSSRDPWNASVPVTGVREGATPCPQSSARHGGKTFHKQDLLGLCRLGVFTCAENGLGNHRPGKHRVFQNKGAVAPPGARVAFPGVAGPSCLGWCTWLDVGAGDVREEGPPSPARQPHPPTQNHWWPPCTVPHVTVTTWVPSDSTSRHRHVPGTVQGGDTIYVF